MSLVLSLSDRGPNVQTGWVSVCNSLKCRSWWEFMYDSNPAFLLCGRSGFGSMEAWGNPAILLWCGLSWSLCVGTGWSLKAALYMYVRRMVWWRKIVTVHFCLYWYYCYDCFFHPVTTLSARCTAYKKCMWLGLLFRLEYIYSIGPGCPGPV